MTEAASKRIAATAPPPPPYRLRKQAMFFPAPTLSQAAELVHRANQDEYVLRLAETARLLEEGGTLCSTLDELAQLAELPELRPAAEQLEPIASVHVARLRVLIRVTATLAAGVGADADDAKLRALCFELARTCQHAEVKIRSHQLWRDGRSDAL